MEIDPNKFEFITFCQSLFVNFSIFDGLGPPELLIKISIPVINFS